MSLNSKSQHTSQNTLRRSAAVRFFFSRSVRGSGVFCLLWAFLFTLLSPFLPLFADDFSDYTPGFFSPNESEWVENFEKEGVSWVPLYQESDVRLTFQRRTETNPHSGHLAEEMVLEFANPGFAFLGHYVDYPILFNETVPSVWVRADRPEITLGVLVVLPETKRSDTETPLTLLLPGGTYRRTGQWEELRFEKDLTELLDETVKAIRAEQKLKIDPKNAYIRQVVLFTEQGRGAVRLWTDDLKIDGHAAQPVSVLDEPERDGCFDPVNLLAFRYRVTNSPVVMEAASDKLRKWRSEPFAVGSELAKKARTKNSLRDKSFVSVYSAQRDPITIPQSVIGEKQAIEPVDFSSQSGTRISTAEYAGTTEAPSRSGVILGSGTRLTSAEFPGGSAGSAPDVQFSQRTLLLDGKTPFAVRAVEYQGEPLSFLKDLRFNAVWLKVPPSPSLLNEARQENMWLIAPPPTGNETVGAGNVPGGNAAYFNGAQVSDDYNKVLIWDIGSNLTGSQFETAAAKAEEIKRLDPYHRPVTANVLTDLRRYSDGTLNILLIKRRPLLTSFDMKDYGLWLRQYPNLMRIGTPFWNEIQTQPDDLLLAQCRFFGATDEMPSIISYEQIRQQVRLSLAANAHGFLFSSNSPLNAEDHETQYRACALELINLELLLIDPWVAGGTADDIIETHQDGFSAAMLSTKSTSLLLPISTDPETQLVFGSGAANSRSFVAPAREGYSADLLLPGNLRKIPSHRRAGGIDMSLDEVSMNSLIFLAQSNWYTRTVAEKAPIFGNRMAELAIRLAKMRLDTYKETVGRIADLGDQGLIPRVRKQPLLTLPDQNAALDSACEELTTAENDLRRGDAAEAYLHAERALREVRMNERRLWKIGTRFDQCLPVLPVSISFSTLPAYIESYDKIASGKVKLTGENRLIGGDMESSDAWTKGKWSRIDVPCPGVQSSLRRAPSAAHQGSLGLSFFVSADGEGAPLQTEVPPLSIEVPVNVHTGELICIQGWIRIDQPLAKGTDGFMIYESQGGIALAQRFYQTNEWQRFAFYRYAAADTDMTLTFALSSYGNVLLDDVSVQPLR